MQVIKITVMKMKNALEGLIIHKAQRRENQWIWIYVNRNFSIWNSKNEKRKSHKDLQELWDNALQDATPFRTRIHSFCREWCILQITNSLFSLLTILLISLTERSVSFFFRFQHVYFTFPICFILYFPIS